jgi:hypothetical protein
LPVVAPEAATDFIVEDPFVFDRRLRAHPAEQADCLHDWRFNRLITPDLRARVFDSIHMVLAVWDPQLAAVSQTWHGYHCPDVGHKLRGSEAVVAVDGERRCGTVRTRIGRTFGATIK